MGEEVLGVIIATEYGCIPVFHCNLIFTAKRMIVAKKGISKEVAALASVETVLARATK